MKRYLAILLAVALAVVIPGASVSTPPEGEIDPMASHVLDQMCQKLAAAKQISFHLDATLDAGELAARRLQGAGFR
jgi:hypothetical protein